MHRSLRTILAAAPALLAAPAFAHDGAGLHFHAEAVLVPLLVAGACAALCIAAAPRLQRLRVRTERRDRRR